MMAWIVELSKEKHSVKSLITPDVLQFWTTTNSGLRAADSSVLERTRACESMVVVAFAVVLRMK